LIKWLLIVKNKSMKTYNIQQQTPEWFALRKGKMTASHAQEIGNNGKGLETYIYKVMSDYFSEVPQEQYTNPDLERGIELEEQARNIYELEKGVSIEKVGFIEMDEFVGCSPDGLIGEDGGIEIKCHNNEKHFKLLLDKKIESGYLWQIQMNLLITGRKWWDYVAYNPNYKNSLIVIRITPDEEMFKSLKEGFIKGQSLIEEIKQKYEKI